MAGGALLSPPHWVVWGKAALFAEVAGEGEVVAMVGPARSTVKGKESRWFVHLWEK
jgi:hypothetical protein